MRAFIGLPNDYCLLPPLDITIYLQKQQQQKLSSLKLSSFDKIRPDNRSCQRHIKTRQQTREREMKRQDIARQGSRF